MRDVGKRVRGMSKAIGVAEVKSRLSEAITEVSRNGKHYVIQRNGKIKADMEKRGTPLTEPDL